MVMRLYGEFLKNSFQQRAAYRINVFLGVFAQILTVGIWIGIWYALLGQGSKSSTSGDIYFADMLTYIIISRGLSTLNQCQTIYIIENKINTGEVGIDLLRPINFKWYMFAHTLGLKLFNFAVQIIPLIFFMVFVYKIFIPSGVYLLLFLVSALIGLVIRFYLFYICGLLSFWYKKINHVNVFLGHCQTLFSGTLIPLWFFPKFLSNIAVFLPFKYIFYLPLTIYMGKNVTVTGAIWLMVQQLIWLFILYLVERMVWRKAVHKVEIQGG